MKTKYKRKFHKNTVTVSINPETNSANIEIMGEWFSNHGLFYPHVIERFKIWPDSVQVIGMDSGYGLTESVKKWLYGLVLKGKLDCIVE